MVMDIRRTRKRRWTLSPEKKTARTSLSFIENTPPHKRKEDSSTESDDDSQINVKSFYGGREKKCFPHSPKRRKAADKVLSKLDVDEVEEFLSLKGKVPGEVLKISNKVKKDVFELSSTSSDSEPVVILKERNRSNKKGNLKISPKLSGGKRSVRSSKKSSPVNTKKNSLLHRKSASVGHIQKSPEVTKSDITNGETTTPISGRKFFKTKTPSSAPKTLGSIIIKKGFNLKFLPTKRSMVSQQKLRNSPIKMNKKSKTQKVFDDTENRNVDNYETHIHTSADNEVENSFDSGFNSRQSNSSSQQSSESQISESGSIKSPLKKQKTDKTTGKQTPTKLSSKQTDIQITDPSSVKSPSKRQKIEKLSKQTPTKLVSKQTDSQNSVPGSGKSPSTRQKNRNLSQTESDVVSINGSVDLFTDSIKDGVISETSSNVSGPSVKRTHQKLFSIFDGTPTSSPAHKGGVDFKRLRKRSPRQSPRLRSRLEKDNKEQMVLDVGQKKFGAVQCEVCGMVYRHADPSDEAMHEKLHQDFLNVLKFPGWKKERVIQEFPEDCSRIIMVLHDDPKYAVKKIEDINNIMGQEMGFPEMSLAFRSKYKAFLFISENKKIEGCCIAEPVTQGYRVIPNSQPSQSDIPQPGHRPWYCHSESEPATVGISRIWVYGQQRRRGIASKLLDAVRQWFQYGVYIEKSQIAFSDPTSDGRQLAHRYTGIPTFLVYKYD